MKITRFAGVALVAFAVLFSTSIASAQWGDLKVTFKVDGKAPTMAKLKADKDAAVCGKMPLFDESFVVGEDGGIKDVIVFLVPDKGTLQIHPDYDAEKAARVELDNNRCQFIPHVALVRTGQTLVLKNSDPVGHNSKLDFLVNTPQNPIIPAKSEFPVKPADLAKPERRATPVSCSIHPWMTAWVLVQDHPYMATSDENGELVIKNLPVGKHTFQFWQESVGNVSAPGKLKFNKGKVEIEIKEGENDLGELKIKPKA
jgi:hypothetical protein